MQKNTTTISSSSIKKQKSYKTIYFVRHAESTHNLKIRECRTWLSLKCLTDPKQKDAPLSEAGTKQVDELKRRVINEGIYKEVDIIITTPLTRCIQTARAFEGFDIPIEVNPLHTEVLHNMCDVGRSPAELAKDFPHLNFSKLDSVWWYTETSEKGNSRESYNSLMERVGKFHQQLRNRTESKIVVIGHSIFLNKLTGKRLTNADYTKMYMDSEGNLLDSDVQSWNCINRIKPIM